MRLNIIISEYDQKKVTNEEVLRHIRETMTRLNNILCRKVISVGHILRRNCLLNEIEGQMTEVKRLRRRTTTTTTHLLDGMRKRRRKLLIEKGGNDSLSIKHKEEIKYIFLKSTGLLTCRIVSNNKNNNNKTIIIIIIITRARILIT